MREGEWEGRKKGGRRTEGDEWNIKCIYIHNAMWYICTSHLKSPV